ncbi:hypothetical protein ACHABQ_00790 [Nesterenkonia aurantiaca]|uniref:hypothetical protein n=1 Tax=Nesterenkonia aurantiaca TaxID=1436010 RepID=UPI003EE5F1D9
MTEKIDFKKTSPRCKARPGHCQIIELPDMQYLMIDGHGDPNTSPAYAAALTSLCPLAYSLKFTSERVMFDAAVPAVRMKRGPGR